MYRRTPLETCLYLILLDLKACMFLVEQQLQTNVNTRRSLAMICNVERLLPAPEGRVPLYRIIAQLIIICTKLLIVPNN